jgi:hypothetical protein
MKQSGIGNTNQGRDDKPDSKDLGDDQTPKVKPKSSVPKKGKPIPASRLVGKVKGL